MIEKSVTSVVNAMTVGAAIGAEGIVLHTGSHKGLGLAAVLDRVVDSLQRILDAAPTGPLLALETMAGQGGTIGTKFSDLGTLLRTVNSPRLATCLDTCHSFAAGYDIRTKDGLKAALAEYDGEIGLDRLALVHANDSKTPLGGFRDRHENIGDGFLGVEAFELLMGHPAFASKAFLLEVPGMATEKSPKGDGPDLENVRRLKAIRDGVPVPRKRRPRLAADVPRDAGQHEEFVLPVQDLAYEVLGDGALLRRDIRVGLELRHQALRHLLVGHALVAGLVPHLPLRFHDDVAEFGWDERVEFAAEHLSDPVGTFTRQFRVKRHRGSPRLSQSVRVVLPAGYDGDAGSRERASRLGARRVLVALLGDPSTHSADLVEVQADGDAALLLVEAAVRLTAGVLLRQAVDLVVRALLGEDGGALEHRVGARRVGILYGDGDVRGAAHVEPLATPGRGVEGQGAIALLDPDQRGVRRTVLVAGDHEGVRGGFVEQIARGVGQGEGNRGLRSSSLRIVSNHESAARVHSAVKGHREGIAAGDNSSTGQNVRRVRDAQQWIAIRYAGASAAPAPR